MSASSVSDGIAPPVTAQVEVLTGLPIFTGIVPSQSVVDGKTITPFSTVAVTDSLGLSIQGMTITLYDSTSSYLRPDRCQRHPVRRQPDQGRRRHLYPDARLHHRRLGGAGRAAVHASPSGGTAFTTDFVLSAFDGATTADSSAIAVTTLCFCAGTRIATPGGETPVERIAAGDLVLNHRGETRPVAWVGVGRVLATRGRRTAATPVIVRKGALADNVPHHDLRVTKGHAVYLDDVLIPIEFLVNHRSIVWDDRAQEVELYHLELDTHDVLLANGAPAESYRDDGNRWLFRNANSGWDMPPQEPCAPVLTGGPIVDAAWQRLLDRAGGPGRMPTTDEPDVHLVADGRRIDGRNGRAGDPSLPPATGRNAGPRGLAGGRAVRGGTGARSAPVGRRREADRVLAGTTASPDRGLGCGAPRRLPYVRGGQRLPLDEWRREPTGDDVRRRGRRR